MHTTKFYLEQVRHRIAERENKPLAKISDYKIAKTLGLSMEGVSHLVNGERFFSPTTAAKVAELIGENPLHVIASAEFERAKKPEDKARWRRIATAALLLTALMGEGNLPTQNPDQLKLIPDDVYYVKRRKDQRAHAVRH